MVVVVAVYCAVSVCRFCTFTQVILLVIRSLDLGNWASFCSLKDVLWRTQLVFHSVEKAEMSFKLLRNEVAHN